MNDVSEKKKKLKHEGMKEKRAIITLSGSPAGTSELITML